MQGTNALTCFSPVSLTTEAYAAMRAVKFVNQQHRSLIFVSMQITHMSGAHNMTGYWTILLVSKV
jgi:hypothetical protein